jgi:phospholipid/cholesterol/gamma-HCH transport system substrate-binding protein
MSERAITRKKPLSSRTLGTIVLAVILALAVYAFNRPRIDTTLQGGESLDATFSRDYKLKAFESSVKLAGVKVGKVSGIEPGDDGTTIRMTLEDGTLDKLGDTPSASIRPALVVGGAYYVELVRGGDDGTFAAGTIPLDRTKVPVELDRVLSTLTPDARDAVQGTVGSLDTTLKKGGREAVRELVRTAPGALAPAGDVLGAVQGTSPDTDLQELVTNARTLAGALNSRGDEVGALLDDLDVSTSALAAGAAPLSQALAAAPSTLTATRAGLQDLDPTLERLTKTARTFRPAARELAPLLADLEPTLSKARPVISDARLVASDARPLVSRLIPTVDDASGVLDDIRGPVLNRAKGPLLGALLSPWHGKGTYAGGGNDHLLYEETGYLLSHSADVFKFHDAQGASGRLMAGVGTSIAGGVFGMSLEQYLESLGLQQPAGPQEEPGIAPDLVDLGGNDPSEITDGLDDLVGDLTGGLPGGLTRNPGSSANSSDAGLASLLPLVSRSTS